MTLLVLAGCLLALPVGYGVAVLAAIWTGVRPGFALVSAVAIGGVLVALTAVSWAGAVADIVFLVILAALAEIDRRLHILPDPLTLALFASGMLAAIMLPEPGGMAALAGAAAGAGGAFALRFAYWHLKGVEGLGLGDVKLMAGLGAWLGIAGLPLLLTTASLGGLVLVIVAARLAGKPVSGQTEAPFGAFLCAAALMLRLLGLAP